MLNGIVEKIFVITTVNSNRVEHITSNLQLNGIKFEFIIAPEANILTKDISVLHSGIDSRPALSLLSTYVSILEYSKINNYSKIAILEDDCYFSIGWDVKFNSFYESVDPEWDLLNIGYHPLHDTDTIKDKINERVYAPKNWHHCTHCMLIKNTAFSRFQEITKEFNYAIPADYIFNEIYKDSRYKSFYPVENFIYQLSTRLDCVYDIPGNSLRFKSLINP